MIFGKEFAFGDQDIMNIYNSIVMMLLNNNTKSETTKLDMAGMLNLAFYLKKFFL